MSKLEDALADLFSEVAVGHDFDLVADDIAAENGLNVVLLKRRFQERYFSPEVARKKARDTAAFSKTTIVDHNKAEAFLRSECEKLGISAQNFLPIAGKTEIYVRFFQDKGVPSCQVIDLTNCTIEVRPAFTVS